MTSNRIIPSSNDIVSVMKDRQLVMRRELDRRGIALKSISFDSGIPYSTLLSYFPGERDATPALMPVSAQFMLCGAIPQDVLSLLLPDGHLIVRAPEQMDHDEVSEACQQFIRAKEQAHHPESPAGRDIADCEDETLRGKFAVIRGGVA